MQVIRSQALLRLQFSLAEGSLLRGILQSVRAHYQIRPADLDAKEAAAWYSTRGCQSAGLNAAETQEWVESLFQFRGETMEAISDWLHRLAPKKETGCLLDLTLDHAPQFLRVLNDHRLLLAARHDLGEKEMSMDWVRILAELPAQQEAALLQVNFLAHVIEILLAHLPDSGADWREQCLDPEMD